MPITPFLGESRLYHLQQTFKVPNPGRHVFFQIYRCQNRFNLSPLQKFSGICLAGNVIELGLSMVSSMQNRRYAANQQKFHCSMYDESAQKEAWSSYLIHLTTIGTVI